MAVCRAHGGLPVGFLLLRYSVLFTVESLSLHYLLVISCLPCLCARLFLCALWSPAGKGLTSWLSFMVSNCEFFTFPLVPGSGVVLDCIFSYLYTHKYFYDPSNSVLQILKMFKNACECRCESNECVANENANAKHGYLICIINIADISRCLILLSHLGEFACEWDVHKHFRGIVKIRNMLLIFVRKTYSQHIREQH